MTCFILHPPAAKHKVHVFRKDNVNLDIRGVQRTEILSQIKYGEGSYFLYSRMRATCPAGLHHSTVQCRVRFFFHTRQLLEDHAEDGAHVGVVGFRRADFAAQRGLVGEGVVGCLRLGRLGDEYVQELLW